MRSDAQLKLRSYKQNEHHERNSTQFIGPSNLLEFVATAGLYVRRERTGRVLDVELPIGMMGATDTRFRHLSRSSGVILLQRSAFFKNCSRSAMPIVANFSKERIHCARCSGVS